MLLTQLCLFTINFFLLQGLQAIRCPAGLFFDIEKQTCDWKDAVKNCKLKNKERKVKPLLYTDEPLCQDGFLACGDGNCIERGLFCNGEKDCSDGSDENTCGELILLISTSAKHDHYLFVLSDFKIKWNLVFNFFMLFRKNSCLS